MIRRRPACRNRRTPVPDVGLFLHAPGLLRSSAPEFFGERRKTQLTVGYRTDRSDFSNFADHPWHSAHNPLLVRARLQPEAPTGVQRLKNCKWVDPTRLEGPPPR